MIFFKSHTIVWPADAPQLLFVVPDPDVDAVTLQLTWYAA